MLLRVRRRRIPLLHLSGMLVTELRQSPKRPTVTWSSSRRGAYASAYDLQLRINSISSGLTVNSVKVWTQHVNGTECRLTGQVFWGGRHLV